MTKLVYVLLDGVGDRPDPTLNFLTPLDSAYTPNLDLVARKGVMGMVHSVGLGISPESDIAVFSMLGYRYASEYMGRGVVEAVGAGLDLRDGDLALRGNFATVADDRTILDRRAGRDLAEVEAKALAEELRSKLVLSQPDASFSFVQTVGHRVVVVFRAKGVKLSANISNTDPAYLRIGGIGVAQMEEPGAKIKEAEPQDDSDESKISAELVNDFTSKSQSLLRRHRVNIARKVAGRKPANAILFRDAGNTLSKIPSMNKKYGLKFACLVDLPVERGIARMTRMKDFAAGDMDDFAEKGKKAAELLANFDAIYVHLKGPDEPGHDGDARLKRKIIEEIDREFFGALLKNISLNEVRIAVSGDHSTPCKLKSHSSDPVPLLISGAGIKPDGSSRFSELQGAKGSIETLEGHQALKRALNL